MVAKVANFKQRLWPSFQLKVGNFNGFASLTNYALRANWHEIELITCFINLYQQSIPINAGIFILLSE